MVVVLVLQLLLAAQEAELPGNHPELKLLMANPTTSSEQPTAVGGLLVMAHNAVAASMPLVPPWAAATGGSPAVAAPE